MNGPPPSPSSLAASCPHPSGSGVRERRIGLGLAALGALMTSIGAALYMLPGPGFPFLVLGVALLTTGIVSAGAHRRGRSRPNTTGGPAR